MLRYLCFYCLFPLSRRDISVLLEKSMMSSILRNQIVSQHFWCLIDDFLRYGRVQIMFRTRAGQNAPPTEYGTAKSNCVLSFFDWRLLEKRSPIKSGFLNRKLSGRAGFWFTEIPCHAIITRVAPLVR